MSTIPPPPSFPPPAPAQPLRRPRRLLAGAALATLLAGGSLATGAAIGLHWQRDVPPSSVAAEEAPSVVADPPSYAGPPSLDGRRAPFAADGGTGTSSSADATAEESAGLVLISSTLTNGTAAGTGILLSSDGTVVTNHHVVEGATDLEVTIASTGETFTARYVGGSTATDVAVLELEDASGLTPAAISSDDAGLGDAVTALGDAGGDGGSLTASPGTVTAVDQDVTVSNTDGTSTTLQDLIQLQAVVVPGDSGGAVLDSDGEVVGMNVAASSDSRNAVGYAIPFDTVLAVADQVRRHQGEGW
ncbi:S1C family serine protease [Nocardioides caeni]|uniref:Trypsin-like serine protease n=1 Tax=Nocardioides caeni TaxID=574700 RepID=A0A4S8NM20_9ACTN|nr:trypsin-like peptidase domain-containing protein [Nocardioides caeni]THV16064.1 trypsin-like serine protease [Nocardioides caeni]